jgi:hypothetical protein
MGRNKNTESGVDSQSSNPEVHPSTPIADTTSPDTGVADDANLPTPPAIPDDLVVPAPPVVPEPPKAPEVPTVPETPDTPAVETVPTRDPIRLVKNISGADIRFIKGEGDKKNSFVIHSRARIPFQSIPLWVSSHIEFHEALKNKNLQNDEI